MSAEQKAALQAIRDNNAVVAGAAKIIKGVNYYVQVNGFLSLREEPDAVLITLLYDPNAACRICGWPVINASVGGLDICPACDCGTPQFRGPQPRPRHRKRPEQRKKIPMWAT